MDGIPVTILDRTWLLDRIFKHNSIAIAVEELGVGKGMEKKVKKLGPSDFKRVTELEALEAKIADGSQYQGNPLHWLRMHYIPRFWLED